MQSVPSNIIPDTFLDEQLPVIMSKDIDYLTQLFNELYDKYSLEEVKRAAIYWINPSEKDLKVQSKRAAKVCKALATMSINNECEYHLINPYNLDIFISMDLMPAYMLSQADDMFHSRKYDEDCIFETCRYIVQNSAIRFSMIFLYQIRHNHAWAQKDNLISMFSILRERLYTELDELEIFKYSKAIQEVFFGIWKAKDSKEFLAFITKSVENPNFPIVKFITYHIDNTQDDSSYLEFLRLFECKELIANRLKSGITEEDMNNPSIALFYKKCVAD